MGLLLYFQELHESLPISYAVRMFSQAASNSWLIPGRISLRSCPMTERTSLFLLMR